MSTTMIERDFPNSLPEFLERFGTEDACAEYLVRQKWAEGFRCECGSTSECLLSTRTIYVCHGCRRHDGLERSGYAHVREVVDGSGLEAHVVLPSVHRAFSLFKRWMFGTHQGGISGKRLQRYLSEFESRFNRRTSHAPNHLFRRLVEGVVRDGYHPYAVLVGKRRAQAVSG